MRFGLSSNLSEMSPSNRTGISKLFVEGLPLKRPITGVPSASERVGGNRVGGNLYRAMWSYLKQHLALTSVLDIGAGMGESVAVFRELGMNAIGIDGSSENAGLSGGKVLHHDFAMGAYSPGQQFDLCWSCFVMEHIDYPLLANAMNTFKSCKYAAVGIGMNHGGTHHVSIHPWEPWWDGVFQQFGFEVIQDTTALMRTPQYATEDNRKHQWWGGTHAPGKILRNMHPASSVDFMQHFPPSSQYPEFSACCPCPFGGACHCQC